MGSIAAAGAAVYEGVATAGAYVAANASAFAAAGTVVAGAASAYESHEQGVATSNADKRKARVEGDQATQQQITMRQNMLRALATQNASAGVGGGGLSTANTMRQITQGQNDLLVTGANASAQTSLLDSAASNAVATGNIGAVGDVAGAAAKLGNIASH